MKKYLKNLSIRDCIYTFLDNKNIIYGLQFGFRQQYSTSYVIINITENIRKAYDDRNISCGVFVDLQKAFDTVDQILLAKLNHYGIHGVPNDWLKSYLSNRSHYVSINGHESGLPAVNCGVPQGSVLGSGLFLSYINDLSQAIKFCKVHHFADDTNLLCLSNLIKKLNKLVNADLNLKHLVLIKACVRYFYQIFIFSPNDNPSKSIKDAFYFIKKALFVLKIIKFLYFRPSLFFFLLAIALEDDRR